MHKLALVVVMLVCVLGVIGAEVELTGDGHVLVPAPEGVGEGFLREVETERFSRALPYLSANLRTSVDEEDLRQLLIRLEHRHGFIEDVRGEESTIEGERAEALVTIKTKSGEVPVRLHFVREKHLWKISALPVPSRWGDALSSPQWKSPVSVNSFVTTSGSASARSEWSI